MQRSESWLIFYGGDRLLICFGIVKQAAQYQSSDDSDHLSDKSNVANLLIVTLMSSTVFIEILLLSV